MVNKQDRDLKYLNKKVKIATNKGNVIIEGSVIDWDKNKIVIEKMMLNSHLIHSKLIHIPRYMIESIEIVEKSSHKPQESEKTRFLGNFVGSETKNGGKDV